MPAVIGALRAELSATIAKFQEDMGKAAASVRDFAKKAEAQGKRLQRVGAQLSVALTAPLVAFGIKAVQAATESAQALGQLDAALKSTEHQAGRTLKQLQAQAKALESLSTFDDDDILKDVTTNLLKFGNVVGTTFDKAQQAIVDMAARTGDLGSAAQAVGRALNDPIQGIAALTRAGIQFTNAEKDQIEALVTHGRGVEAQALILEKLERAYGGAAKALRDATPTAALNQQWRDLMETVGQIALTVLPPLIDALKSVAEWFNDLSPTMQRFVFVAGAIAAALGPIAFLLGGVLRAAAALAPIVSKLAFAIGAITVATWGWIAAITAVIAALVIFWKSVKDILHGDFEKAWEDAKKTAVDMWTDLQALFSKKPLEVPVELKGDTSEFIEPGKQNFNQPDRDTRALPAVEVTKRREPSISLRDIESENIAIETQRILDAIAARRETTMAQEQAVDLHQRRGDTGVVSEEALRRQQIARDLFDQQIAAEERIAQLEGERRQAELFGDTDSMERLGGLIIQQQQLLDLVKDTSVEQVRAQEQAEDAWGEFFDTISHEFKQMARDGQLTFDGLRNALREALFKAFVDPHIDAATNALQGIAKGIGSAIGGLFGGASAGAGGGFGGAGFSDLPVFAADGGFVPPSEWGVVGERGPELVFGGKRGMTVFSNEDSRGMLGGGGGQTVNQTFNIRTQDANSFGRTQRQLARQSKRALQEA